MLLSHLDAAVQPSLATTKTDPTKNQALLAAAEEAGRLLNTKEEQQHKNFKHPAFHDELPEQQEVLNAANALLLLSNDPILQKFIATLCQQQPPARQQEERQEREQLSSSSSSSSSPRSAQSEQTANEHIAIIHRTFLSLTVRCLDHYFSIASSKSSTSTDDDPSPLFDAALKLARRAHDELRLPFHLPLYQRLMEAAVSSSASSNSNAVDTVLEIAVFCKTLNPDSIQNAALFRPVLTALISQGKLNDAVQLLMMMKTLLKVTVWDYSTIAEIYQQLHRVVKDSFLTVGRRDFTEYPYTAIVELLEPALLHPQQKEQQLSQIQQSYRAAMSRFHRMIDRLDEKEREQVLRDLMALATDDSDEEDEDEDDEEPDEPEDPLDQVVHSILTKDVKSPSARRQFAEMITAAKKPPVPKSVEIMLERSSRPRRSSHDEPYTFVAWPDEEESEEDDGLSDDDDDDDDVRTPGRRSSSFLYSDAHRFPDITAQVMRLNQGRRLEFTKIYEDYLWNSNWDLYEPDFDDDYESSDDEDLPDLV